MTMEQTHHATRDGSALVIERTFNAPRALVWKAWTECEHLSRWWGPNGYTVPSCRIDLRVGGKYHVCMRSPESQDTWSTGTYREIVADRRLVATDSFADEHGNVVSAAHYGFQVEMPLEMIISITLEDVDGGTRMTLRHEGMPAGDMSDMAGVGWNEFFDKLATLVREM